MLIFAVGATLLSEQPSHAELFFLLAAMVFTIGGIVIGSIVAMIAPKRTMNHAGVAGCIAWLFVMAASSHWRTAFMFLGL